MNSHGYTSAMSDKPLFDTNLKVGDFVTFTNSYGVVFEDYVIIGFPKEPDSRSVAYVDSDCWWCGKDVESLTYQANILNNSMKPCLGSTDLPKGLSIEDVSHFELKQYSISDLRFVAVCKGATDDIEETIHVIEKLDERKEGFHVMKDRITRFAHHYRKGLIYTT